MMNELPREPDDFLPEDKLEKIVFDDNPMADASSISEAEGDVDDAVSDNDDDTDVIDDQDLAMADENGDDGSVHELRRLMAVEMTDVLATHSFQLCIEEERAANMLQGYRDDVEEGIQPTVRFLQICILEHLLEHGSLAPSEKQSIMNAAVQLAKEYAVIIDEGEEGGQAMDRIFLQLLVMFRRNGIIEAAADAQR